MLEHTLRTPNLHGQLLEAHAVATKRANNIDAWKSVHSPIPLDPHPQTYPVGGRRAGWLSWTSWNLLSVPTTPTVKYCTMTKLGNAHHNCSHNHSVARAGHGLI